MIELTVLLIGITVILLILYLKDNMSIWKTSENFENFYLSSCPSGYKSFYNNNGDTVCCDGDILVNKCLSDNQCTLNGSGTSDIPNCTKLIQKLYDNRAKQYCMASLPNYFEDRSKNIKGCMSGPLNNTMTGPQKLNQPTCFIYQSSEENINSTNSCTNQKLLDTTSCFGNNCTKKLVQPIENVAPLVEISFTDTSGIHRVAYTQESMEHFLNTTNPNWKNEGIDLTKNISVAEVAKAFYIDKTVDKSHIQF